MASKSTTTTTAATSSTPSSLPQVGIIPEFNCTTDDWTIYREILEEFFKANAIPEDNRVSVLVSVIGAETYRLLRDLCHPETPTQKTYEQLCALLGQQFIPEIAIFRERAKFYRAEQCRGEDVKAWYARLKKLSVDCKFGEHLEPLLLDKFVVGLASGPVLDRLCEENETLTLKEAIDLAANRESALQDEDMVEGIVDLTLDEHGHHRGKHHHHRHPHHHPGGHHGRFGPPGPHHGGHHGPPRGHHGPPGPHDFGWGHGFGPQHFGPRCGGPAERRGPPPFSPEFGRACHRFGRMERGCPFKPRSREMKRWAKKWRKHARYMASSSSSSGSSNSSSSSSDSNSSDDDEFRHKHHKGHKDAQGRHGGGGGAGGHHGFHGKKHGHGRRCQRKEKPAKEQPGTENTEPELIE